MDRGVRGMTAKNELSEKRDGDRNSGMSLLKSTKNVQFVYYLFPFVTSMSCIVSTLFIKGLYGISTKRMDETMKRSIKRN